VAVSVFPGEQYEAPRSWSERAYPKLIHYNKVGKGGHFAAWEQPYLFTAELREAFKSLRWLSMALIQGCTYCRARYIRICAALSSMASPETSSSAFLSFPVNAKGAL
jgi:hypothetical protein